MKIEDIVTPALLFDHKFQTMEFVRDKNFLSVTTTSGLKRGVMINSIVIDSTGNAFVILSAKKKRDYYSFWKFEFFDPFIYIEIELKKTSRIEFNDLKNKIEKIIKRNKNQWINHGNIVDMTESISQSQLYGDLISEVGNLVEPKL